MSLRQVLSIYNAERQLNEDDTALLNTLRRLKDGERELLVQELSDKPQKKPGKGRASKSSTKSQRASGMASAISRSLESSRKVVASDDAAERCMLESSDGPCFKLADDNVHHRQTDPDYHPFVSPAQSADGSSSANDAGDSSTASSETGKDAASNVHHAGG